MIEITQEMRNIHAKRVAEVESMVDGRILMAVERGENVAIFGCNRDEHADVYDEIREKYERAGYRIKPTGFIRGVWKRTEDICW